MRPLLASLAALVLLCAASSAWALDGYADRKGLFTGIGFGGGMGAVNMHDNNATAGMDDGRPLGLQVNGIIGGGISDNIVLGSQLNGWIRSVEKGSQSYSHNHWNMLAVGDFFVFDGLYLEAGGGLAYSIFDGTQGSNTTERQEMGLSLRAGAGFEYFINGTHALGFNAGYTRHFYSMADFDTFGGGISIRWY